MDEQGTIRTLWLLRLGDTGTGIEDLARRLRATGAQVHGPTDQLPVDAIRLLIVAIAEGHDADPAEVATRLAPWHDRIVPVVEGATASQVFGDLSQLVLGQVPLDQVVARINLVAQVGGPELAALVRLEGAAGQWVRAGRPTSALLRSGAVDESLSVVSAAAGLATPDVSNYVRASLANRRRRTRTQLIAVVTVALLLLVGSLVALLQQRSASTAASRADDRSTTAESIRLAGLATDTLGTDPDLPWLLASEALRTRRTPQAIEAARRIEQAVPKHRTVQLPGLASSLSTDPRSGVIALGYVDGRAEVRAGADGRLLHTLVPKGGPAAGVAVAPGGRLVTVGRRIVDTARGTVVRTLSGAFQGWAGASQVLVATPSGLGSLDVRTGTTRSFGVALIHGEDTAFSLAADAPIATVLDGDRVVSVDLNSGLVAPTARVPNAVDVATSADGQRVFVASTTQSAIFDRKANSLTRVDSAPPSRAVVATTTSWLTSYGEDPVRQIGLTSGTTIQSYLAHRGPTSGIGALPAGRSATTGADSRLRLWSPLPTVHYPDRADQLQIDDFDLVNVLARSFRRPLLALSPRGGPLAYTQPNLGSVGLADQDTLAGTSRLFVGLVNTSGLPLAGGRVMLFSAAGECRLVDLVHRRVVWGRAIAGLPQSTMIAGSNAEGSRFAYAVSTGLTSFGRSGDPRSTSFRTPSTPVAVYVDGSGAASAVTSDGSWYHEGRDASTVPTPSSPLAAAAPDGTGGLWELGTNGTVSHYGHGRLRTIAQLGAAVGGFALRVSPDGSRVAVIGVSSSVVLSSADGETVADLSPVDARYSTVRDIALRGDRVWAVRADGGLITTSPRSVDELADALDRDAPRPMTKSERVSLDGVAATVGAN